MEQNSTNFKVDLSNCDKEPIHLVGKIQPHGAIIVADKHTRKIEQASSNAPAFIGVQKEQLLGANLDKMLGCDILQKSPVIINDSVFIAHLSEDKIVLEIERFVPEPGTTNLDDIQALTSYTKAITAQATERDAAAILAERVQQNLDYDRVMIYKFDEDWHGGVIAEKVKPGITSYYDHHFPASDIPAQAREMLLQKVSRQIPDVDCTPVDLISLDGCERDVPIDLLRSELRYPSEIHLEFLRNMNVRATFTTSIIVKGKLWGIIACQNHSALNIHYPARKVCELMSRYFASFLEGLKEKLDSEELEYYRYNKNEIIRAIQYYESIPEALEVASENLARVTGAGGVAVFFDDTFTTYGNVPPDTEILNLIEWLVEIDISDIFHTNNLSRFYQPASAFAEQASGILTVAIHKLSREYVIWFKPQIMLTRLWAGDPNKPATAGTGRIHPRKSFENWQEQVKEKSQRWSASEITVAEEMRQEMVNMKIAFQNNKLLKAIDHLTRAQAELKESNQKLQAANKDLEGFSYTVSHDLRSPLTSVIAATDLLLTSYSKNMEPTALKLLEITHLQSKKMNDLVQEVLNYAKAGLVWSKREKINMNELLAAILNDLNLPSNIQVTADSLPVVSYNKVQLTQVLQNLVDNARKYNDKSLGTIVISAKERPKEWEITVSDNGMGIEAKNYNKVFEAFGTAHGEQRKDSIGIGLAIVKKIVETNGGRIGFTSKVKEGSVFTFTIPK